MDWIFFGPARLVALWPWAGVAIAAALMVLQLAAGAIRGRAPAAGLLREPAVFAAILWLIFSAYEPQVARLNLGFRLDLVFLVPVLYVMTAAGLWWLIRPAAENRKPPGLEGSDQASKD